MIRRATAVSGAEVQQALLQLQRLYGNGHVQRVLEIAQQSDEEEELQVRKRQDQEEAALPLESAIIRKRGDGQALDSGARTQTGADLGGGRTRWRPAGSALRAVVLRQEGAAPSVEPPVAWDALQSEFERLLLELLKLNDLEPVRGERTDLIQEHRGLWAQIGAPGEKSDTELARLRTKLQAFKNARAEDHAVALDTWKVLEEEYQTERARLAASRELSDRKALDYLDASHQRAKKRKDAVGQYLRWYDISDLGDVMTSERHIEKGWEAALRETIDVAPEATDEGSLTSWPWPEFKATQLIIESGAQTPHEMANLQAAIRRQLGSAIRHQVRQSVITMLELGETQGAATDWARAARARAGEAADELVKKIPLTGHTAHTWSHRLHIAGKITIYVDIGASVIDIWASPPKERPKKIVIHGSRIAGGLAGVAAGARVGAKLGARLGPKGAAVGGFIGGIAGGFIGAWTAKKVTTFIVNEIWPPEDTSVESVRR
jgi:hypothetical protein